MHYLDVTKGSWIMLNISQVTRKVGGREAKILLFFLFILSGNSHTVSDKLEVSASKIFEGKTDG